ncbi:MAG: AraC family transcriptional regulator [Xanthomonadales bacterium]|nr:AraC family transcriptional regulator [Xanthomonadales bacterium]
MYRSFEPSEPLSPYVECYWSWRIDPAAPVLESILPDVAPELIVHMASAPSAQDEVGDWRQQDQAFLYCAAHKSLVLQITRPMSLFAVRFRPWGAGRFSNTSMAAMLDRPIPPAEALGDMGARLVASLVKAESDASRVKLANQALEAALQLPIRSEARMKMLLDATNGGRCSSAEMAGKLSMSDRSFSRLWNEIVGIQPRKYIQLMRLHNALEKIDAGAPLAQVAAECGYSDQAHMARQIKAITGLAPSVLRRRLGDGVYQDLYASRPAAPWQVPH